MRKIVLKTQNGYGLVSHHNSSKYAYFYM